jgi:alkanesulfonate monooxygenase SsuD/methylene tetrahydromethanopterin reductase-like flavin-dependent oxidoreductase (luciferase family)
MLRDQHCDVEELRDLSYRLEDAGYESVLLTFHSAQADYFIKSAAAIIPGHKLKYMIALRPYHVSPQYCAMMTIGHNQIDKDRLMFNWVAGDFHNREDEPDLEFDIFGKSDAIDTIAKRTTFVRDFVKMYKLYCPVAVRPRMVFSGFSEYALDTVRMFNATSLCMLDTYRELPDRFDGIENRMVAAVVTILDSEEEIEKYKEKVVTLNPRHMLFSIVGTHESVKEQILKLKDEKITDLLIVTYTVYMDDSWNDSTWNTENHAKVNKLVKEINSEINQHVN